MFFTFHLYPLILTFISNPNPNHNSNGEKFEVSHQEICNTMGYPGTSSLYFFYFKLTLALISSLYFNGKYH